MLWEIILHAEFEKWFFEQEQAVQDSIATAIDVLEEKGAQLGRPYVDTLKGSEFPNMKELRVQHAGEPYRIIFAFDPKRQAVLLLGGNKAGKKRWYQINIPIADRRFREYLEETEEGELV
ncbi:type II toxin-antitoxin system RelE/ParE family toxin [Roseofilum capinflatum]|uniref:Type II toxin-antitoxin system RelE/ParE family toxin n=1 Tax=Roseofilum capinflatum BLCC-M114 TaxID=3022440 RepID=A0ABT7B8U6_9CYAN|nr:type II toxin-antitoxin system RelE/ParE family toxin [Roseofilum capinflatum]MDJ1175237.1 type II toxin-antitoxin system RelE/ParE family toxin [Roseofilum capinflatum BLCC-M114]